MSTKKSIFYLLMLLWVGLSGISVLYNATKSISEIREWMPLTYDEKRAKIFGNLHFFFTFVESNTAKDDDILIYSKDVKTFYLSKYYLYPRIVDSTDNIQELQKKVKEKKYTHVATDSFIFKNPNYTKVNSQKVHENSVYTLYKIDE